MHTPSINVDNDHKFEHVDCALQGIVCIDSLLSRNSRLRMYPVIRNDVNPSIDIVNHVEKYTSDAAISDQFPHKVIENCDLNNGQRFVCFSQMYLPSPIGLRSYPLAGSH